MDELEEQLDMLQHALAVMADVRDFEWRRFGRIRAELDGVRAAARRNDRHFFHTSELVMALADLGLDMTEPVHQPVIPLWVRVRYGDVRMAATREAARRRGETWTDEMEVALQARYFVEPETRARYWARERDRNTRRRRVVSDYDAEQIRLWADRAHRGLRGVE